MKMNLLAFLLWISALPFAALPSALAAERAQAAGEAVSEAEGVPEANDPDLNDDKHMVSTWQEEMKGLTPAIFSDHMVLQRQMPVPVWGTTAPGGTVTVTFMNQTKTATADAKGKWRVNLDPMEAVSEPQEMTVQDAQEKRVFTDVLVGEVWLGSGQSNMEFGSDFNDAFKRRRGWLKEGEVTTTLGGAVDGPTKQVLKRAIGNPMIRVSSKTRDHLTTRNTGREQIDETNVITLSALAGCLAVHLQEELKVPVGIVVRAVSGTAMARWVDGRTFLDDPKVKKEGERYAVAESKRAGKPVKPALTGTAANQGFGNLYREYIVPVQPYGIRGVLWDQGEWGIGYRGVGWPTAMQVLINSWQADWGQGDFPWSATNHYDKEYKLEEQLKARGVIGFMVARTDGLSRALHPQNKWEYTKKHLENIMPRVYHLPAPQWHPLAPER